MTGISSHTRRSARRRASNCSSSVARPELARPPNRGQLVEFLRQEQPDVLFCVGTYGSGAAIEAGLNEGLPKGPHTTDPGVKPARPSDPDETMPYPPVARARYVRLTALEGLRGTAGVAELHLYERPAA